MSISALAEPSGKTNDWTAWYCLLEEADNIKVKNWHLQQGVCRSRARNFRQEASVKVEDIC